MVYFTVGGKPEQAEFTSDFPVDEIKGRVTVFYMYNFIALLVGLLCFVLLALF